MSKKETAPAVQATQVPAPLALPSELQDLLMADAGAGLENMSREDFAIPRMAVLQQLSPQLDRTSGSYVEGAEAGDIYDTVTHAIVKGDVGIKVILVAYRRAYLEWFPRGSRAGKGFVADHGDDSTVLNTCQRDEKSKAMLTPNNTEIVQTAEYYAALLNGDMTDFAGRCVLSMSKSQLKYAKRLNTMISQYMVPRPDGKGLFNPAMFYRAYHLTTTPEKNDQGTWFSWKVEPGPDLLALPDGVRLYQAARAYRDAVMDGKVQAAAPASEPVEGDGDGKTPF